MDNLIDITEARKKMTEATKNGFMGNISGVIKTQSGFAFVGGVAGFVYSIAMRKSWFQCTFLGLLAGGVAGWAATGVMKDFEILD